MDKARIAAIWTELQQYGDETQLGFPLSTIKVGELAELISEHAGFADTIERLTKERDEALKQFAVDAAQAQNQIDAAAAQRVQIKDLQGRLWSVRESRDHARKQRDAALAENKKLNGVIGGLSAQSQDEIDRLTVTANNNAAAHAKACEDLAQARAEVERLKDTRKEPCQHCGSTDPKRSAAFCKRCEWQQ